MARRILWVGRQVGLAWRMARRVGLARLSAVGLGLSAVGMGLSALGLGLSPLLALLVSSED